jgi:DNA polymerase-3 subunit gamma/tau
MRALSELLSPARLLQMLSVLQATTADLGRSANPRTDAELCLIRLCDPTLDGSTAGLTARVEQLEQRLEYGVPAAPAQAPAAPARPVPRAPARPVQIAPPQPSGDLPPWDMGAPPAPKAPPKAPPQPASQAAPPQTAPPKAAPRAAAPAAPGSSAAFWKSLCAALQNKVPMGEYTFLIDPAATVGDYRDGVLTLWADSEFVEGLLKKTSVLDPVTREAARLAGRNVQVFVKLGKPAPVPASAPPPTQVPAQSPPAHDNFNDLLAMGRQFDNIEIKE